MHEPDDSMAPPDSPVQLLVLRSGAEPPGMADFAAALAGPGMPCRVEVAGSPEAASGRPEGVLLPLTEVAAAPVATVREQLPGIPVILVLPASSAPDLAAVLAAGAHDSLNADDRDPRLIRRVLQSAAHNQRSEGLHRRYETLLERNPDGFWITDLEGRIREVNAACCEMVGYRRDELLTMSIADLEIDETPAETAAHAAFVAGTGGDRFETRHRHRDGGEVHLEVSAHLLAEGDGLIMAVFRDITQRRRAERELEEKTRQLTAVLETAGDAIITADSDGRIHYCNPAAERMFGRPAAALVGGRVESLMPEPHAGRHAGYIGRYEREGEPRIIGAGREVEALHADGTTFPVELNVSDTGLQGPRLYLALIRDISERKAAEAALQQRQAELAEAQRIAHLGNWVSDLITGAIRWSDEVYRIFGLEPEEWGATHEAFLRAVHPDDRDRVRAAVEAALVPGGPVYEIEHRIVRPDGEVRHVYQCGSVDFDAEDRPLRMAGVVLDITRRRELEAELRRLATTDALTGLPNRRHFLELAEAEHQRAARYGRPFSLVMLDVDYFKALNDDYGHDAGDEVLRALGTLLPGALRGEAVAGRLGGEEFGVLLPEARAEEAVAAAERIRVRLAATPIATAAGALAITASLGVVTCTGGEDAVAGLITRADTALYAAKRAGRNRTRID